MTTEEGGAIFIWGGEVKLSHNTITENRTTSPYSSRGGGICIYYNSICTGNNNIIWNNNAADFPDYCGYLDLTYTDCSQDLSGWGNISVDPLFTDTLNDDYQITWANFPVSDSTKSPCIDAGDPLSPLDPDETIADMGALYFDQNQQGVKSRNFETAEDFKLYPPYPNPFNQSTAISYQLTVKSFVNLSIYDIAGREVARLVDGYKSVGQHSVTFNGTDLASGVYFMRIQAGDETGIQKLILMK